jgi:plastocyanin
MKKHIAAGAVTVVAAGAIAIPAFGATSTVQLKDNVFAPTRITVKKGTTVRWVWKGKAPHNVKVTRGPVKFGSKTQVKGSFSRRLTKAGTYSIVCTIHAPAMKMTIRVK